MYRGILLLGFLALVVDAQVAQTDPIVNFCRRIWHSSVIRDEVLYINGGLQSYSNVNSTTGEKYGNLSYGINQYVIKMDLTQTWNWRNSSSPIKLLPKGNGNETPPNLSRGALYAGASNDTKLYAYGGTVDSSVNSSWDGFQHPTSNQDSLWSYDLSTSLWAHDTISDTALIRPASGASAEATELGLGFWFNGEQDSGTSSESVNLYNTVKFLKGMIVLDFNTGEARNLSTSAVSDLARVRGEMVYIPGSMVLWFHWHKLRYLMLHHYIIRAHRTGHVASAPDGSSHNIYMHGGRGTSGDYYDDIHVLSIPSFTWTRIYSGTAYRYGMKCHLAGNRQMITKRGFYDMSTTEWGPTFFADAAPYQVPRRIVDVIGGNVNGSATLIAPTSGFQDAALYSLFPNSSDGQTTATGTATGAPVDPSSPPSSPSSSNTGAIAGGVIGGLAGIALIGAGIFFLRRRRHQQPAPAYTAGDPTVEAGSSSLYEKDGTLKVNHELQGDAAFREGNVPLAEMSGGISTFPPLELPGESAPQR
ncbi:uncharacterized protein LAJ45_11368 [Morchella importuna]|uniref:uncharacterized protein n=1 Tax=Morchella importuna TaxID=1174673 RepID=UPI001E8DF2D7|nr:uncharacterized protein LAJ45_11368 [Morchella importuna]KAH8144600.1 hypothetical protein LAJ45_11368 [Morchella importuna]